MAQVNHCIITMLTTISEHICTQTHTHALTRVVFLDPTQALWTRSFLSPSCMPLSPAIACITEEWRHHNGCHFVLSIPQATLHPRKCTLFLEDINGIVNHLVMPTALPLHCPILHNILQNVSYFLLQQLFIQFSQLFCTSTWNSSCIKNLVALRL